MLRSTFIAAGLALSLGTAASAATHVYDLNGSYTDSLAGNSLVSGGGTLDATGYTFDANQGLSLDLNGILSDFGVYTIETSFYFDNLDYFEKILDFKGLTSDNGMYTYYTESSFYPVIGAPTGFVAGQYATLAMTRTAAGIFSASVNGITQLTFDDSVTQYAVFTGGVANFFADDDDTVTEASSGRVDYITVSGAVPEPATWALMLVGFGALGYAVRRRRITSALAA